MKYEINKPNSELTEGYTVLITKYITLFALGWAGSWVFLFFMSTKSSSNEGGLGNLIYGNMTVTSIVIALIVVFLIGKKVIQKYKLGLITLFEFEEDKIKLGLLNTINGSFKTKEIKHQDLTISTEIKESGLFGKQRLISIYDKNELINKLNIELSAWCRHPQIEGIVETLLEIDPKTEYKNSKIKE